LLVSRRPIARNDRPPGSNNANQAIERIMNFFPVALAARQAIRHDEIA
jgi:hypothetical protein